MSDKNPVSNETANLESNLTAAEIDNGCTSQRLGSPVADLEPTIKATPRKSDEPIDRGKQQNPQTSHHDIE